MPRPTKTNLAGAILAILLLAGCSGSGTSESAITTAAPDTTAIDTYVGASRLEQGLRYNEVGRLSLEVVDESRGTDGNESQGVEPQDSRTLPLLVLYPAQKSDDDTTPVTTLLDDEPFDVPEIVDDAPVADGEFPLFVFSHGVTADGPTYQEMLQFIAAHGYVVVAPTYPLTSGSGGWGNVAQVANQPADVSFIISEMLELSSSADGLLTKRIDPDRIGVGGHSLGAITSLGLLNSCCADERVGAVIAISGILLSFPEGDFDDPLETPLLLIHGEQDDILSFEGGSEAIYDESLDTVPRAFLGYPEAGHVDLLANPPFVQTTIAAIYGFLDRELQADGQGWADLNAHLERGEVGELVTSDNF